MFYNVKVCVLWLHFQILDLSSYSVSPSKEELQFHAWLPIIEFRQHSVNATGCLSRTGIPLETLSGHTWKETRQMHFICHEVVIKRVLII